MDRNHLPPISSPPAPSSAAILTQRGASGAVLPLPPLLPLPRGDSPAPDTFPRTPSPLLSEPVSSVFLTETYEESPAGGNGATPLVNEAEGERRRGPWRAPPAAIRVGSFIRSHRLSIHLQGCNKCREETMSVFRAWSVPRMRGKSTRRSSGGGGGRWRRGRRSASGRQKPLGGRARSRSPAKKCSSLCVHPTIRGRGTKGQRSPSNKGRSNGSAKTPNSPPFPRSGKGRGQMVDEERDSEIGTLTDMKRLTVYHNRDFTQMTWEELMALLNTNFRRYPKLSEKIIRELEEIKLEILEKIEAGLLEGKDPRLSWKNRQTLLTLQLTHVSRARDIYSALWEALSNHNEHMKRLPALLQVRAFREVHSFSTDYLKSGGPLLRFTQIPGRLCRGISLYQACLAVVIGRRWVLRVLDRHLKRLSNQTEDVNDAIDSILKYKFQELPADRMRVSHLLAKLDDLTRWFENTKSQMLNTVKTLHEDLETRRQQQIEETITSTMDAEVDGNSDWKDMYDFNRCLMGLVEDMAARNARLKRMIEETRSGAHRRTRDDEKWHAWILQQASGEDMGERLNISRTRWLPV